MSQKDKPSASFLTRWASAITAPEPSHWNREEWKAWKRDKEHARGMLRSWGLGDDGKPKVTA